ncbi:pectinesterase inhibitor-like [Momordica charantia]|uniref:Pectinesterase inhibitor-like n=1 Tax=Momordica charantia TaxID=3673 RepID=A0A6J1DZB1_MOMCH|nr:pectinesterase inhibitor-like [Momordica charantia]
MAKSSVAVSSLILAFLLLQSHAEAEAGSENDVASTICPKTRNPVFCESVSKSAGRLGSPDLKTLATYTLILFLTKVVDSLKLAKSLAAEAEGTANPQLKERYISCSKAYQQALGDVGKAYKILASGDHNGLNLATSAVTTAVDDCDAEFKQPPADTSSLPRNGNTLKDLCSIISVMSQLLPGLWRSTQ